LFYTYPKKELPDLTGYVVLTIEGPELSSEDSQAGLVLVDASWKYAERMLRVIPPHIPRRSLPAHIKTAYPRRQDDCPTPETGLASIEALYAAYAILGWDTSGLLDDYHWREDFLIKNNFKN